MNRLGIIFVAMAFLAAPDLFWLRPNSPVQPAPGTYTAPGLKPMGPDTAGQELSTLLPALLLVVYDAFARTEEACRSTTPWQSPDAG